MKRKKTRRGSQWLKSLHHIYFEKATKDGHIISKHWRYIYTYDINKLNIDKHLKKDIKLKDNEVFIIKSISKLN